MQNIYEAFLSKLNLVREINLDPVIQSELSQKGKKKNHLLYLVAQLCPTLCDTMDCSPPVSSVHGDSFQEEYWSELSCPPPGDLPNPGIKPRSPALQSDSLLSKPPGKLKNTRVGSLSLLQGIFPTQEPNRYVLHCRQILYQLKY